MLTLTVQPAPSRDASATVTEAVWEPARIGPDGLPVPTHGPAASVFDANRDSLRDCAGLTS